MSKDKLLKAIEEKYKKLGVPLDSMLEGLLWSTPITYWDYIQTDALLGLQIPRTDQPDEMVFIMYHQVNELLFKMVLWEIDQVAKTNEVSAEKFAIHLMRISRYFDMLSNSFTVMADGMERDQYLKFRNTLTPASGFQSAQYRMIELGCAPVINIVAESKREELRRSSVEEQMEAIYWRDGAKIESTGQPAYTAVQFIEKYWDDFLFAAEAYEHCNIWERFCELKRSGLSDDELESLENVLRLLDLNVNVNWPLQHYKTAVRYLSKKPIDIAATGGTNWQKYLPPRFQRRIFYPELWTATQRAEWGKSWVEEVLKEIEAVK